jgi:site-specific recombinase XerD
MTSKPTRYPVELLAPDEVQALMDVCGRRAPTGVRNRAMICLLYRTGLRIAEALRLAHKDISLDTRSLVVLHGKGNKRRVVGIDDAVTAELRRWFAAKRKIKLGLATPVFCTLDGEPVQGAYVRMLLPRLAKRAGILKRVHAHALRHTFSSELASEGVPINVIQQALGHSSVQTTSRYLDHIAPMQVIHTLSSRVMQAPARRPRRRRKPVGGDAGE